MFTLLFLIFLMIMDYPFLVRLYNRGRESEVSMAYEETLTKLPDSGRQKLLEEARAYNEGLASGTGRKLQAVLSGETAADGEQDEKLHAEYERLLNTGEDGVMGRLEIPKIRVDLLIGHGTSDEVLEKGAGHLEGSSLPVGGENTHACISAHRGLVGRKLFTNLDELREGDLFFLYVLNEKLCYRVEDIRTVLPEETKELAIRRGEDLVTLITCTPYGVNTHRLCVEGSRIPYTEETVAEAAQQAEVQAPTRFLQDWAWIPVSLLLLAAMCVMLGRYNRRNKSVQKH